MMNSIFRLCASAVLLGMAVQTATAQEMPRYDIEKHCTEVSDFGGGSAMLYNSCVEMEQDAYNARKREWPSIPARLRDYCDEVAQFGGGSYSLLDSCIDMEQDAISTTPTFQY